MLQKTLLKSNKTITTTTTMKIIILKENLIKGLNIVEKAVEKNLNLPILNNVLISVEKNILSLTTTNLEIAIKYWTLVKMEKEGKITVPIKFLSQLISFLPLEKINLEVKNKILYITSKKYKNQINGLGDEDFPIVPKIKTDDFFEVNIAPFIDGLSRVAAFPALSQTRPELSGIYFNFQKDNLKMVATDSFRLVEKILNFEKSNNLTKNYSFILPQKTAQNLADIFFGYRGKMKIYFSPAQILFEYKGEDVASPKIQIISRLIEGEYINYQDAIPKKYTTKIILSRNELINQIKTAGLFSGKTNEIRIAASPQKKEVEIFSRNPDFGENQSFLEAKIEGEEVKVSFNFRFLLDGLANIKSSEVLFELNGEEKAVVLKPVGDSSYIYVVMPIMPI